MQQTALDNPGLLKSNICTIDGTLLYQYRQYFHVEVSKAESMILLRALFSYFDIDTFEMTQFKCFTLHTLQLVYSNYT